MFHIPAKLFEFTVTRKEVKLFVSTKMSSFVLRMCHEKRVEAIRVGLRDPVDICSPALLYKDYTDLEAKVEISPLEYALVYSPNEILWELLRRPQLPNFDSVREILRKVERRIGPDRLATMKAFLADPVKWRITHDFERWMQEKIEEFQEEEEELRRFRLRMRQLERGTRVRKGLRERHIL